ncbi:hypothetical protein ACTA71_000755 [Dictyostelium dimigraforme]
MKLQFNLKYLLIIILIIIINQILIIDCKENKILENFKSGSVCPYPLKYRERTGSDDHDFDLGFVYARNDTNCLLPCPSPIYTSEEVNTLSLMVKITGTISFVASLILLLIYSPLINRMGFNRHTISIFFLTFSVFLIMLTDIIYVHHGNNLICPTSHRYSRQGDSGCSITGLLFQFGCLAAVLFWANLSLDLYLTLKKISTKKVEKWYLIILTLIALILTFVPLAKKSYGYLVTGLACWILDPTDQIIFFWAPFTAILGIGSILIVLIVYEIYKISKITKHNRGIFQSHIRPLLMVLFIFGQFLFILAFNALINNKYEEYKDKLDGYIDCLFSSSSYSYLCKLKTFPFEMEFIVLFFLRLIGIEVLIFYGFTQQTKKIILHSFLVNNRFFKKYFIRLDGASLDFSTVDEELKVVNFSTCINTNDCNNNNNNNLNNNNNNNNNNLNNNNNNNLNNNLNNLNNNSNNNLKKSINLNSSNNQLEPLSSQKLSENGNVNVFMVESFDNNNSMINQFNHLEEKNNIILNSIISPLQEEQYEEDEINNNINDDNSDNSVDNNNNNDK